MHSTVNESVKIIVKHKANLMKNSPKYKDYIRDILKEHGITASDETMRVFIMGAVDGMIYDIGAALDFTKQKDSVDDWTSYKKRKEILKEIFLRNKAF